LVFQNQTYIDQILQYLISSKIGWIRVFSAEECADLCDENPACASFEFKPSTSEGPGRRSAICSLNWEEKPTDAKPALSSLFCRKPSLLKPYTVSSDTGDFWLTKGANASIFTSLFTFWAYDHPVEAMQQFTVSVLNDPIRLRLDEGELGAAHKAAGWRRMFAFWASAEKRPGLSPVTAAPQTEAPHSLSLSRGDEDVWNPRSTKFWAYLPPLFTRHLCQLHVVVEKELVEQLAGGDMAVMTRKVEKELVEQLAGGDMAVMTRKVEEVVSKLNQIYVGSIFQEYGIQFRVVKVQLAELDCKERECSQVERLLEWFTDQEADTEACLKYLFTFREFSEGTTGLGWKGSICTKKFKSRRMAPRNCGLVTFLNNNKTRTTAEAARTLAHEIGHNFGANHEEDTPCEATAGGGEGKLAGGIGVR